MEQQIIGITEKIIEDAINRKSGNLSEFESKQVLSAYGIPVTIAI